MEQTTAETVRSELAAMRRAREELGQGYAYFTTQQAVEHCPIEVSPERLLGYPEWICPRVTKNPRATRGSAAYWDPRDIIALPFVLRRWEAAIRENREAAFEEERRRFLAERDRLAFERIMKSTGIQGHEDHDG